jgi:hypothetical protein
MRPVRFVLWILLPLTVGCGEEPRSPQFPVSGKVTVDGKPLEQGLISFLPSVSGPAASAPIEAGAFALDRTDGPGQGPYKVEIVSVQSTGRQVVSPDDPSVTIEETRNIIPTRYNARSDLLVQVSADGENAYRFDISSKEPRTRARPRRRR